MKRIIKSNGEEEVFKKFKIIRTAVRAGASRKLAENIAGKVYYKINNGDSSKKVLDLVLKYLKGDKGVAARYDLKRAIMNLGPHGFSFEEYFSQILKEYGYETTTNNYIKGKVVIQEVDIIAKKDKKVFMIEAKYHNQFGGRVKSKEAMYTYARFLDIKNSIKVNQPWLVTNTKCTDNAIGYSTGVGQKITAWNYPERENLRELIEKKNLYPVTVFKSVSGHVKEKLFGADILMAKDLFEYGVNELVEKTGLRSKGVKKVLDEAGRVVGG